MDLSPSESPRRVELRWYMLAFANAVGPGLALWAWTRSDRKAVLLDNVLSEGTSPWDALPWALGSALLLGLLYLAVAMRARDREDALRRLTALLAPLAVTVTLPLMYV